MEYSRTIPWEAVSDRITERVPFGLSSREGSKNIPNKQSILSKGTEG